MKEKRVKKNGKFDQKCYTGDYGHLDAKFNRVTAKYRLLLLLLTRYPPRMIKEL